MCPWNTDDTPAVSTLPLYSRKKPSNGKQQLPILIKNPCQAGGNVRWAAVPFKKKKNKRPGEINEWPDNLLQYKTEEGPSPRGGLETNAENVRRWSSYCSRVLLATPSMTYTPRSSPYDM